MKRVFQRSFKPSHLHHRTHKVHLGEANTIAAAEVSLAVRTLKAAGCDETQPEMLKTLNQVLWLTRAICHVDLCSGRAPKLAN